VQLSAISRQLSGKTLLRPAFAEKFLH
jgi:hypothetical protein